MKKVLKLFIFWTIYFNKIHWNGLLFFGFSTNNHQHCHSHLAAEWHACANLWNNETNSTPAQPASSLATFDLLKHINALFLSNDFLFGLLSFCRISMKGPGDFFFLIIIIMDVPTQMRGGEREPSRNKRKAEEEKEKQVVFIQYLFLSAAISPCPDDD